MNWRKNPSTDRRSIRCENYQCVETPFTSPKFLVFMYRFNPPGGIGYEENFKLAKAACERDAESRV